MATGHRAGLAWRKTISISPPVGRCAVLGLIVLLSGCGQSPSPPVMPPAQVNVIEVQLRELPLELEYAAQLFGIREVEVRARVSGILLERRYGEGDAVKAGDVLFRIDPAPFSAEVARARANLAVQQAALQQATRERDRIVPLYDGKLASQRERDTAVSAYESAKATVAAAEAALRTAELNLSYTDVRAPIAGLTSREVRSEGNLVTTGADSALLTYIVQDDRLFVDLALPEGDAQRVRAAHDARPEAVVVQVLDSAGMPRGAGAHIEFISPRVDEATGTVAVRAVLDNADRALPPGSVVRVRVLGVSVPASLVVPRRAVLHSAQGALVWVVGEGGKAAPREVTLGTSAGNKVVVTSGLVAGDQVVVDGILKVQPGALLVATMLDRDGAPTPNAGANPASSAGDR